MKANLFRRLINMWPPYLGAGIRIKHISKDYKRFDVEMKMRFYNKNYVGTHFGGSLYAMTDPFYMMILLKNLGKDYIVWDKSAGITFIKPASGTITGIFEIDCGTLERIREEVDQLGKNTYHFETDLLNEAGEAVAHVTKEVYVRAKTNT